MTYPPAWLRACNINTPSRTNGIRINTLLAHSTTITTMKTRIVTFKLRVPYPSNPTGTAPAYASALASSIKTILVTPLSRTIIRKLTTHNQETRLPILADDPATDTGLVPVQVLIIVEPTPEMCVDRRGYALLYLVAGCTVVGGFLWVVCGILTAFAGSVAPSVGVVRCSFE